MNVIPSNKYKSKNLFVKLICDVGENFSVQLNTRIVFFITLFLSEVKKLL